MFNNRAIEVTFPCGGIMYTVTDGRNYYMNSHEAVRHEHGAVRNINERLWSVSRCVQDSTVGWGMPKWYTEWVPVDSKYTKEDFVAYILAEAHKGLLS